MNAFSTAQREIDACDARTIRPLRIVIGYAWSVGLLLIGLYLWDQQPAYLFDLMATGLSVARYPWSLILRTLAVFAVSGGFFVFMALVADQLCPRTPMIIREFLAFFTGSLAMGALAWAFWLVWINVL